MADTVTIPLIICLTWPHARQFIIDRRLKFFNVDRCFKSNYLVSHHFLKSPDKKLANSATAPIRRLLTKKQLKKRPLDHEMCRVISALFIPLGSGYIFNYPVMRITEAEDPLERSPHFRLSPPFSTYWEGRPEGWKSTTTGSRHLPTFGKSIRVIDYLWGIGGPTALIMEATTSPSYACDFRKKKKSPSNSSIIACT